MNIQRIYVKPIEHQESMSSPSLKYLMGKAILVKTITEV